MTYSVYGYCLNCGLHMKLNCSQSEMFSIERVIDILKFRDSLKATDSVI